MVGIDLALIKAGVSRESSNPVDRKHDVYRSGVGELSSLVRKSIGAKPVCVNTTSMVVHSADYASINVDHA